MATISRGLIKGHEDVEEEARQAEARRELAHARLLRVSEVQQKLEVMKGEYFQLVGSEDPRNRGFLLEKVIKNLFNLFDLDAKASFKITGEQIDGAFSLEGTDYILEARWRNKATTAQELDGLAGKLSRKLENTLGLFLSINGYSDDAVKTLQSGRRLVILMDGSDLMAVLEGRIDLVQLLLRKRRHAAQTGNIYLRIHEILSA